MASEASKTLPEECPFCGGTATVTKTISLSYQLTHRCKLLGFIGGEFYREGAAEEAWSTRAVPPAKPEIGFLCNECGVQMAVVEPSAELKTVMDASYNPTKKPLVKG